MRPERIRIRVLAALAMALSALLLATVLCTYGLQKWALRRNFSTILGGLEQLFQIEQEEEANLLSAQIYRIEEDKALQATWLARDRDALLRHTLPLLERMRSEFLTTHFYFIEPDGTCFLRVHQPDSHGDAIDRFTLALAMQEGKPAQGIELGPLGTLTLRVVRPWRIGGELVGYLELGEEIEHLTLKMRDILGAELVLLIRKEHLKRSGWEDGLKIMARARDWDAFPDHVVSDSTLENIPPDMVEEMERHKTEHKKFVFKISREGREYVGGFVPFLDARGREIGDFIVLEDVTDARAFAGRFLIIQAAVSAGVGLALLGFLFVYIGRIETSLVGAHESLKEEIAVRKRAEEEREKTIGDLQDALAKIKTLRGIVPICMRCKKIRNDKGFWSHVEVFVREHSEAEFSHGLCPDCYQNELKELD